MILIFNIIFILTILALIVVNLKTMLLPNAIIFPGFVIAFFVRIFLVIIGSSSESIAATVLDSLIGAFIGFGVLWLINQIWYRTRNVECFGYGDMKMLGMIGAYLGILNTIGVLFLGIVLIVICLFLLSLIAKDKFSFLPTGFIWGIPSILFTLVSVNQIYVWLIG